MRALLVTAEYPPAECGGIGVFYRGLARELAALGAEVHVLAPSRTGEETSRRREEGVEVHRMANLDGPPLRFRVGKWRFDGAAVARARALSAAAGGLAREIQPDVVETHDWAAPLWRPPARPFVVRLHGSSTVLACAQGKRPPRLQRLLERRMLHQADHWVAASEWVRVQSANALDVPLASIAVLPNGVDTERFQPGPVERLDEVVFAGRIREDKGVVELLQALEIVLRRRPGVCATFAGGPDAWYDLSPRIRAAIERVQLAAPNRLRMLGRVSQEELAGLYRRAGVCVFPSFAEAFGLACVEAMSCGAAVAASRLAAGTEIVEDGYSGLLIDPRDTAGMAEALLTVLAKPGLRRSLGEQARKRVLERYSIRLTALRTMALYDQAVKESEAWRRTRAA